MLHTYIPEFEDDFYDVFKRGKDQVVTKNYIVKVYVLGTILMKMFLWSEKHLILIKKSEIHCILYLNQILRGRLLI